MSSQRPALTVLGSVLGLAAPLFLLAQLLTSCGSDSADTACQPGDSHDCTCGSSSTVGKQSCNADGSGYDLCSCEGATGGGGSGGGGGGGSGGSSQAPGNAGSGSMAPSAMFSGFVGTPCTSDASCAVAPGGGPPRSDSPLVCIKATSNTEFTTTETPAGGGPQGGYCSVPCTADADCSSIDDISACNTALGYCFALCIPGASQVKCGSDRAQVCFPIRQDNTLGACIPRCTSDASCGANRFCDPSLLGLCVDAAPQGGKVGDPCTPENELTDCASGLCLEYTDPANPDVSAGSFCSANCTFGLSNGCGFDTVTGGQRGAGCFQPQIRGGQPGDIGYCFPVCDTDQDCVQAGAGWVCDLFNDVNAEQQVGRKGECLPAAVANRGAADAGPG